MATHKLLLLPGDGIGPEVMGEVKRLIEWLNAQGIAHFAHLGRTEGVERFRGAPRRH